MSLAPQSANKFVETESYFSINVMMEIQLMVMVVAQNAKFRPAINVLEAQFDVLRNVSTLKPI